MDLDYTPEQLQLKASARRFLDERYSFQVRRAAVSSPEGWSRVMWQELGSLGFTATVIGDAYGGLGGSATDLLALLEETGKSLIVEPLMSSCVLAAKAIELSASPEDRLRILPSIATGSAIAAWAHDEKSADGIRLHVEAMAREHADGWQLHGRKVNVIHAAAAEHIVVTARTCGSCHGREGVALFLVERGADGLRIEDFRLLDDTPAGVVHLDGVVAKRLKGGSLPAAKTIERVGAWWIAATCADMLGAAEAAFELSRSYLNARRQFGRPLSANQALRHRIADMKIALETVRSMAMLAAMAVDEEPSAEVAIDLARAKFITGRHAREVCEASIQLHGGIGLTLEHPVGHCLRRIAVADTMAGSGADHLTRLAELTI